MNDELDPAILARLVEWYDESEEPLSPDTLTEQLDGNHEAIADCLETFAANDFLAPVEGGYRPTVTARELLELDIDFEETVLVLDLNPPDGDGCN